MRFRSALLLLLASCSAPSSSASSDAGTLAPDAEGPPRALGANDLSVLFPLPRTASELRGLVSADAAGRGGAILSRDAFGRIDQPEPLTNVISGHDATYAALAVVAFRYDPCFMASWGGVACQPQIRLVLQAIVTSPQIEAADGALHLMFDLDAATDASVRAGLDRLARLGPENADPVLKVNPALTAQGLRGVYGTALAALIQASCGPQNLVRMTFMTRTSVRRATWRFGGFNLRDADSTGPEGPLPIFGVSANLQSVANEALGQPSIAFGVVPAFGDANGRPGADGAMFGAFAEGSTELVGLRRWADQHANAGMPPIATDTTDCASCHLAGHVRRELETAFGPSDFAIEHEGERVSGAADLDRNNLRAFGYVGREPVITERVANETAHALSRL